MLLAPPLLLKHLFNEDEGLQRQATPQLRPAVYTIGAGPA